MDEMSDPLSPIVPGDSVGLFPGDCGTLLHESRKVLVNLLLGDIDCEEKGLLWQQLLRDEDNIRSCLHNLFLDLVIDRVGRIAFLRQVSFEDEKSPPILLRRAHLTKLQSVLVLYLRDCLRRSETTGYREVVTLKDIMSHLALFKRTGEKDHAGFATSCQGAIDKLKNYKILKRVDDDRYVVNPALRLIFPIEEVAALKEVYERLRGDVQDERVDDLSEEEDEV